MCMYCPHCGIHNLDTRLSCAVCDADVSTPPEKGAAVTILTNLSAFPFRAIARVLVRNNALSAILTVPFAFVIYWTRKLRGAALWSPMMTSRTPKFHLTDMARIPNLRHAQFAAAEQALRKEGFEPLCDLEEVSLTQATIQHIMRHPTRHTYAALMISKGNGTILYTAFSAFFSGNRFLSVDNAHASPFIFPENMRVSHLEKQPVQQVYQEFLRQVAAISDQPEQAELKTLLPKYYQFRVAMIEAGLQQGLFALKDNRPSSAAAPTLIPCYQHSGQAAVRTCAGCGVGLCDACYTERDHQPYCQRCLAEQAGAAPLSSELAEGEGYAGFAARCVASIGDMIMIFAMFAALFFTCAYLLKMVFPNESGYGLPLLLTELLGSICLIWYLIAPIARYGRTLGQKLWGLRVVDAHGNTPELVAALIRFAYLLVSCLFLFPLIGYLFVLFAPKKQGWHDRLAGTYVVTKRPRLKAALAWTLLALMFAGVAGGAYHFRNGFIVPLLAAFYGSAPDIVLQPAWEYPPEKAEAEMTSFVNRGDVCIAATADAVFAVEMKTGTIRWTNTQLAGMVLKPQSENQRLPVIAARQENRGDTVIARFDPDSGQLLWQQTLPLAFAEVTFDEQTIAAYTGRAVSVLDMNGRTLWTKQIGGDADISYAQWHSGLLIGRFREKQNDEVDITLTYLDRLSGDVVWEQQQSQEFPRYVVEKDLQIFSKSTGGVTLLHIPDQQRIWETSNNINDIVAQDDTTLYSMTGALDKQSGARRFDYPSGSSFTGLTDDFVLAFQEMNPQKKSLLVLDKISGEVKQKIEHRAWYFAKYLTEDEHSLYLAMYSKPEGAGSTDIRSELARIDKQTFAITSIPVGNNLGMLQFEVFTQEQLVFIPSFQRLGGYALRER